ncbi:MAG: hypothetical protein JWP02_2697 [Acidimicrobiales bacterium]|nr:hypothetical protein [Acidimicrobiales bacterium]
MGMDELEDIAGLEAQGAPATAEALKSIVARHQRARTRTLGVALAVALVAGPVAGWALASNGQGGGRQVATGAAPEQSRRDAAAPAMATGGGSMGFAGPFGGPDAPSAHHLFTRTTADGIVVRAYRMDPPAPPAGTSTSTSVPTGKGAPAAGVACSGFVTGGPGKPVPPEAGTSSGSPGQASSNASASASANSGAGAESSAGPANADSSPPAPGTPAPLPCPVPPACNPTPLVMAELSNDAAVGQGFVPLASDAPSAVLSQVGTGMFGLAESSPAVWAAVRTGPGMSTVRLRLPSGETDQMAPVEGVAVLAHGTTKPPPDGTVVEALDGSGNVIGSEAVNSPQSGQRVTACAVAVGGVATATAKASAPPTTR